MRIHWLAVTLGLACGAIGCTRPPAYLYGEDLSNLEFHPEETRPFIGVYPDTSVLNDLNNPFLDGWPSETGKWVVQSNANPAAAFYAWATFNAHQAGGEAQYYTAINMEAIWKKGLLGPEELEQVKQLAVEQFQAVLDYFPDSQTYDSTGMIPYSLALFSLQQMVDGMGAQPKNGWGLIEEPMKAPVVVRP